MRRGPSLAGMRASSTTRSPTNGGLGSDTDVNYFATATSNT